MNEEELDLQAKMFHEDYIKPGNASTHLPNEMLHSIKIPGLAGKYNQIAGKYDYDLDKCKCPSCGGLGVPWRGWFSCEDCKCKAIISDGRSFMPVT